MNFLFRKKWIGLVGRIFLAYLIFILLITTFNQNNFDRLQSFLVVFFSAISAIFYLGSGSVRLYGFNITKLLIIGFLVKIFFGYLFWEFYIFPDYFSISTSKIHFDHFEYLYTNVLMEQFANYRISNGFFSYPSEALLLKSSFIHYFMSNMYLTGSFNILDLSVQNSLFSIFSALIISHIVKLEGGSPKQIKFALLLTLYLPMTLISSIIWRDIVGLFFVILGGYLLYRATKTNVRLMFILVILASLSMYMHRYLYAFFPISALLCYSFFTKGNKIALFLIPFLMYFVFSLDSFFSLSDHLIVNYGDNITGFKLWLFLPVNIIRVFIGPFPWMNWFAFDDNSIFLISDYLQSVVNIGLVVFLVQLLFKKRNKLKVKSIFTVISSVDFLFIILTFFFVIAGVGTKEVHSVYMSTGISFLIPSISLLYSNEKYKSIFYTIFGLFILLNIFFLIFGLGGTGIGHSFR